MQNTDPENPVSILKQNNIFKPIADGLSLFSDSAFLTAYTNAKKNMLYPDAHLLYFKAGVDALQRYLDAKGHNLGGIIDAAVRDFMGK